MTVLFITGGNPGTMGFDAYAEMSGFDHYVDRSQYPKKKEDYDGKWGIFDEPFFQFFKSLYIHRANCFF